MAETIFLDLDQTLFDTPTFMADIRSVSERHFAIPVQQMYDTYPNFRVHHNGMDHYDFFRHMKSFGVQPNEVEDLLHEELAGNTYTYSDVPDFVNFVRNKTDDVSVLTYGEPCFQTLKYQLAPALASLAFKDVLMPKGDYLQEQFQKVHGMLIDDKKVERLPEGIRHVWLQRGVVAIDGSYPSLRAVASDWDSVIA